MRKRVIRYGAVGFGLVAAVAVFAFNAGTLIGVARQSDGPLRGNVMLGWGANNTGQLGRGNLLDATDDPTRHDVAVSNPRQVAAALHHTVVLDGDGSVWAWGDNDYGQLGDGTTKPALKPQRLADLTRVTQVAAVQDHSLALDADGIVWSWGLNTSGQIGDGGHADRLRPYRVPGLPKIRQVIAGNRSSLALDEDGALWAWGGNCQAAARTDKQLKATLDLLATPGYSDATGGTIDHVTPVDDCINEAILGIRRSSPAKVADLPRFESVAAGFGHMLGLDAAGAVWAWGCNQYGQLGRGNLENPPKLRTAQRIDGLPRVTVIAAGFRHSMALTESGDVYTWGHNYYGELGHGEAGAAAGIATPGKVELGFAAGRIATGHDYSLAVSRSGELSGWGYADFGQLGPNAATGTAVTRVWGLTGVKSVAAGGGHVVATLTKEHPVR